MPTEKTRRRRGLGHVTTHSDPVSNADAQASPVVQSAKLRNVHRRIKEQCGTLLSLSEQTPWTDQEWDSARSATARLGDMLGHWLEPEQQSAMGPPLERAKRICASAYPQVPITDCAVFGKWSNAESNFEDMGAILERARDLHTKVKFESRAEYLIRELKQATHLRALADPERSFDQTETEQSLMTDIHIHAVQKALLQSLYADEPGGTDAQGYVNPLPCSQWKPINVVSVAGNCVTSSSTLSNLAKSVDAFITRWDGVDESTDTASFKESTETLAHELATLHHPPSVAIGGGPLPETGADTPVTAWRAGETSTSGSGRGRWQHVYATKRQSPLSVADGSSR